jgi:hypothetical protein
LFLFFRLLVGYVLHPDGRMDSVSWSDFEFYEHGEDGNPPKELVLNFIAGKFYPYTVKPALVTTSIKQ